MRTTISVPDEIFEEANQLAERLGKTRSQLYTEAMVEFLTKHDPATVTQRLDKVLESLSEPEDRFVTETAKNILTKLER